MRKVCIAVKGHILASFHRCDGALCRQVVLQDDAAVGVELCSDIRFGDGLFKGDVPGFVSIAAGSNGNLRVGKHSFRLHGEVFPSRHVQAGIIQIHRAVCGVADHHIGSGNDGGLRDLCKRLAFHSAVHGEGIDHDFCTGIDAKAAVVFHIGRTQIDLALGNQVHHGSFVFARLIGADIQRLLGHDVLVGLQVNHAAVDNGHVAEEHIALGGFSPEGGIAQLTKAVHGDIVAEDDILVGFDEGVGFQIAVAFKVPEVYLAGCFDLHGVLGCADRTAGCRYEGHVASRCGDVGHLAAGGIVAVDEAAGGVVHGDGHAAAGDVAQIVLGTGHFADILRLFCGAAHFDRTVRTDDLALILQQSHIHAGNHGQRDGARREVSAGQFSRFVIHDVVPNTLIQRVVFLHAVHGAGGQNASLGLCDHIEGDLCFLNEEHFFTGSILESGAGNSGIVHLVAQRLVNVHAVYAGLRLLFPGHQQHPVVGVCIKLVVIIQHIAGDGAVFKAGNGLQHHLLVLDGSVALISLLDGDDGHVDDVAVIAHQIGGDDLFRLVPAGYRIVHRSEGSHAAGHFNHAVAAGVFDRAEDDRLTIQAGVAALLNEERVRNAVGIGVDYEVVGRKAGLLDLHAVGFAHDGHSIIGRGIEADLVRVALADLTVIIHLAAGGSQRKADLIEPAVGKFVLPGSKILSMRIINPLVLLVDFAAPDTQVPRLVSGRDINVPICSAQCLIDGPECSIFSAGCRIGSHTEASLMVVGVPDFLHMSQFEGAFTASFINDCVPLVRRIVITNNELGEVCQHAFASLQTCEVVPFVRAAGGSDLGVKFIFAINKIILAFPVLEFPVNDTVLIALVGNGRPVVGASIIFVFVYMEFLILTGTGITRSQALQQVCPDGIGRCVVGQHVRLAQLTLDDVIGIDAGVKVVVRGSFVVVPLLQRAHGRDSAQISLVDDLVVFVALHLAGVVGIGVHELELAFADQLHQPVAADGRQQCLVGVAVHDRQFAGGQVESYARGQRYAVAGRVVLVISQAEVNAVLGNADDLSFCVGEDAGTIGQQVDGYAGGDVVAFQIVLQGRTVGNGHILREALQAVHHVLQRTGHGNGNGLGTGLLIQALGCIQQQVHFAAGHDVPGVEVGFEGFRARSQAGPLVGGHHFHHHGRERQVHIAGRVDADEGLLLQFFHRFIGGVGEQPCGEALAGAFTHIVCTGDDQHVGPYRRNRAAAADRTDALHAGQVTHRNDAVFI